MTPSSIISTIKSSIDIIDSLINVKNKLSSSKNSDDEVNSHLIDLRSKLNEALKEHYELIIEHNNLRAEYNELKRNFEANQSWDENEMSNHELVTLPAGGVVYQLKDLNGTQETKTYLCPQCFIQKTKSILQPTTIANHAYMLRCHQCSSEYRGEKYEDANFGSIGRNSLYDELDNYTGSKLKW